MSKRKPYVRAIQSSWWQSLRAYRLYILRESTAIPTVWFSLILIYAVLAMGKGGSAFDGFIAFLQNPFILILNIVTLVAVLFHSKTWFVCAPKASMLIVKGKKVPDIVPIMGLWSVTLIVSIAILLLALKWY